MQQTPSNWLYIGTWVGAGFASRIVGTILDYVLAEAMVTETGGLEFYLIVSSVIIGAATAACWIGVYNLVPTLNLNKVMPWIWILGGISNLVGAGRTITEYQSFGLEMPPIFIPTVIVAYLIWALGFRFWFKRKGRIGTQEDEAERLSKVFD